MIFDTYIEMRCPITKHIGYFETSSRAEAYAMAEEAGWRFAEYTTETGDFESNGVWIFTPEINLADHGLAIRDEVEDV